MMSCREIVQLASEGLDHPLSLRQRIALRLHVSMCSACARYRRQLRALDRIFRAACTASGRAKPGAAAGAVAPRLSAAKREELRRRLGSG